MMHTLKIRPQFFDSVKNGIKTCEIRRNDRDFRVGDTLHLREWKPGTWEKDGYTNRSCEAVITHILTHDELPEGIPDGFVALSIRVLNKATIEVHTGV